MRRGSHFCSDIPLVTFAGLKGVVDIVQSSPDYPRAGHPRRRHGV